MVACGMKGVVVAGGMKGVVLAGRMKEAEGCADGEFVEGEEQLLPDGLTLDILIRVAGPRFDISGGRAGGVTASLLMGYPDI